MKALLPDHEDDDDYVPTDPVRLWFYHLMHPFFNAMILCSIIMTSAVLAYEIPRTAEKEEWLVPVELFFNLLFSLEFAVKVTALGCNYFVSRWNRLDFFVVFCGWLTLAVERTSGDSSLGVVKMMRLFRLIAARSRSSRCCARSPTPWWACLIVRRAVPTRAPPPCPQSPAAAPRRRASERRRRLLHTQASERRLLPRRTVRNTFLLIFFFMIILHLPRRAPRLRAAVRLRRPQWVYPHGTVCSMSGGGGNAQPTRPAWTRVTGHVDLSGLMPYYVSKDDRWDPNPSTPTRATSCHDNFMWAFLAVFQIWLASAGRT